MLVLTALLIALVGTVAFELRGADLQPPLAPITAAGAGRSTPAAAPAGVSVTDVDNLHVATILARPLFSPDRRPLETGGEAEAGPGRLTGVMVTSTGKTAIFAGPANGRPLAVREGEHVGRDIIASISADAVTIVGSGGQRILHPSFDPNPPPRPAAAAQTAPGGPPRFQPAAERLPVANGGSAPTPRPGLSRP
jgi:general secretion pathway protein N